MLRDIGDGNPPDFTGKNVIVVGGGNVAMDATRSAIRLGAKNVSVMYRRRKADMTALMDEIEAAIAEGAEILELHAPQAIETNKKGQVTAMVADPKIIGLITGGVLLRQIPEENQYISLVTSLLLLSDKILFPNHLNVPAFLPDVDVSWQKKTALSQKKMVCLPVVTV